MTDIHNQRSASDGGVRNTFRALRFGAFRSFFLSQLLSASGSFVQQTALAWAVLSLTGSPSTLGIVLAAGGIPFLLLGPFGGQLADRFDNRKLLLVTQASYGLLDTALWLLALSGHLTVPLIIGVNALGGLLQVADSPARQAFVSQLVPADALASAVSLNGVLVNSSRVIGPAIAGILIVTSGTTACFAINAATYLAPFLVLIFIRPNAPDPGRKTPSGLREALRYVSRHQQLYVPLSMMALIGLVAFNFNLVLPLLAKLVYHGGGGTYGLLSTMLSIGSVIGSLAAGALGHPRQRRLVLAAIAFAITLTLTALAPDIPLACIALLLAGCSGFLLVTTASTSLHVHTAPGYRGRVMALWSFVFLGTTPLGNLLAGWLSDRFGTRSPLWAGALASVLAAVIATRVKVPQNVDDLMRD